MIANNVMLTIVEKLLENETEEEEAAIFFEALVEFFEYEELLQ